MKKSLMLFGFGVLMAGSGFGQAGEWTWMKGDSTGNFSNHFGILGIPDPLNQPYALYQSASWVDKAGNFWLYGGSQVGIAYGDLWKFDTSTNYWTWMNGSGLGNASPVYGTKGIAAAVNTPGGIGYGIVSWCDSLGNLWMFGGNNLTTGSQNSLWKYDISTNMWAWISGDNFTNSSGNYGTLGIPSVNNTPGGKDECNTGWVDNNNNLWLYGGQIFSSQYNDLWKYNIGTNEWCWMNGNNVLNIPASYGVKGVFSPTNNPGARNTYTHWKDTSGNLWLCGGGTGWGDIYNDMWQYDISINQWGWMSGDSVSQGPGFYGNKCSVTANALPPSRIENKSCWADTCGNFWMFGGGYWVTIFSNLNDLWVYKPFTNEWRWISGDSIVNSRGYYGTIGLSAPMNRPSSRTGSCSWYKSDGSLWLYGGSTQFGESNDLWRFIPDTACINCTQNFPLANLTSNLNSLCPGTCIEFLNLSLNSNSYQWLFPGANPSTDTTANPQNICYNTPGNYDVTLIATNTFGSDTVTLTNLIHVYPQPALPVITQIGNDLHATSGYATYQWYYISDTIAGATDSIYTATQNGNYNLVVTDSNGCNVGVGILNVVVEPDGLTPTLSKGEGVAVYPNPASEKLYVTCYMLYDSEINFEIYNSIGERVYTIITNEKEIVINTSDFSSGIYLVKISSIENIMTKKIVIEK